MQNEYISQSVHVWWYNHPKSNYYLFSQMTLYTKIIKHTSSLHIFTITIPYRGNFGARNIWWISQIWPMFMDLPHFNCYCIFLWHSYIFRLLGITLTWLVDRTAYTYIVSSFFQLLVDHGNSQLTYRAPQSCLCPTHLHLNLSLHLHQEIFTGCLWTH